MDILGALSDTGQFPEGPVEAPLSYCSRRGCQEIAQWKLLWNNPKVHTSERRKVWLACSEHRQFLEDFLSSRSFLKEVLPFSAEDEL
ncbi:acetone carboxylase [Rothia sp. P6271]|uniref:acetone carboxylase n=1 Tax=Rothia sp. P6271 TaxID=3402659 RepID=UPI003ACB2F07